MTTRWYQHGGVAVFRSAASPSELVLPAWPDAASGMEAWCHWISHAWENTGLAAAITHTSPVLAERVEVVCAGHRPTLAHARSMALSIARYAARMTGRATPFGLFAGVATAHFDQPMMLWGTQDRVVARADASWVANLIADLEASRTLLRRLPLGVNDLAVVRGDRVVVLSSPHASHPGDSVTARVSVRHSRAVRLILDAARSPQRGEDLIGKLAAELPNADLAAIEDMVAELVRRGVLISSLRPPSTATNGLAHVLDHLAKAGIVGAQDTSASALHDIRTRLDSITSVPRPSSAAPVPLGVMTEEMLGVAGGGAQPVMVDLRRDCAVVVPQQVAAEAEAAAGALLRLTPDLHGTPAWRDYHLRFLNHYGAQLLVPVTELVDPTVGLGLPAGYATASPEAQSPLTDRDERLLVLAQQAALDGAREVVLDDADISALAGTEADGCLDRIPHLELCGEVRASTLAALNKGEFTLAVTGVSRTAAAMSGRFLDVLPDADRQEFASLYRRLPLITYDAISAQLSCPPLHPRLENVARSPLLTRTVISLGEHHDPERDRIPIEDLAISADPDRLYLVSLSRRRVVEPLLAHAAAMDAIPALARFLFEVPRARSAAVTPWRWGAAARLPYLPRIRYGRVVLAPARWRIPALAHASEREWTTAFASLRDRLDLPATVHAGAGDRLLRLDLDEPRDLAILRAHARQAADSFTVSEAPSEADHGWCGGRAHEFVIPLLATNTPNRRPAVLDATGPLVYGRDHCALPGSTVLYAQLFAHTDLHDLILIGELPDLLDTWERQPQWWFIRYTDPQPHLRLRIHLAPAEKGDATTQLSDWAHDLRDRGLLGRLTLDTYFPETGRYGTGEAMAAAERAFAADSAAALTQLAARSRTALQPLAVTAASLIDIAAAMTGSVSNGMRWLIDHPKLARTTRRIDRALQTEATMLAEPTSGQALLHESEDGPFIADAWQRRRTELADYATKLTDPRQAVSLNSALGSLLHLHVIRAHGIDTDTERLCHRLARNAALSWTARNRTGADQ